MPLDLALFASKLKRFREQLQLSLTEVSSATGISEESLAAFERAQQEPTGGEILILADYFKCDYKFFISNQRLTPFEQTETLFRRFGIEFVKEDRWAVQEFLFLCECEEFLMEQLPGIARKAFSFRKLGRFYKKHGEDAANALRRHLGYPFNRIEVDIYSDFRGVGLHVFRRKLHNSNISGLYIKHPIAGKCILVNYTEDIYRQRFTAAHEAAHAFLDDDEDFIVSFSRSRSDYREVRANTFASHYLMPPEFLKNIPDPTRWSPEKALIWANRLKVSTEALAYALTGADLISEEVQNQIKAFRVSAELKTDPELPSDLSPRSRQRREELLHRGLSNYYVNLCFRGYEQGLISLGRLAEVLLVSEHDLNEIADLYGRKLYEH